MAFTEGLDIIFPGATDYMEAASSIVEHQIEAFAQENLNFPFWNGRKLTIKEIEHSLCEYSKYTACKKSKMTHFRYYETRSYLDNEKPCHICKEEKEDGQLCETCLCFYCTDCVPVVSSSISWICSRCVAFDAQFCAPMATLSSNDQMTVGGEVKMASCVDANTELQPTLSHASGDSQPLGEEDPVILDVTENEEELAPKSREKKNPTDDISASISKTETESKSLLMGNYGIGNAGDEEIDACV